MKNNDERIREILQIIASLPKGNISFKKIKGKEQPYLQWTENGKRYSRYIKTSVREETLRAVEYRKKLEQELHALTREDSGMTVQSPSGPYHVLPAYETRVITGNSLNDLCRQIKDFRERDCMNILHRYLETGTPGRICLLYGLRRTGKTTMVLQAIDTLPKDQTAYIKIMSSDTLPALEHDLKMLHSQGIRYVFIDEVTLLKDFIDSASLFSDIYAMLGMKIVLSGTDSLGFLLSSEDELYDRAYTIHTTFIPFREYSRLLGIHDVDEYIRYGGTFRIGETAFDDPALQDESISFRDDESTRRYIDSAIAHNIQHSLSCYRNGTHFRHLLDLYDAGELTGAINRIIEDMNHSFLLSVLTRDFISNDLGISRRNLRKEHVSDALDRIDEHMVTERLRQILDIRTRKEMTVTLTADHVREIKEYLYLLDLIVDCPIETIGTEKPVEHILFTQPGMRYSQAQALVFSLMKDEMFSSLHPQERSMVTERILQEVRGRMLEDIILLETLRTAKKNQHVCKLQFATGEFDMLICDTEKYTCRIFEIKHSTKTDKKQFRHLIDTDKCCLAEQQYGEITERCVIYRGPEKTIGNIRYLNAEKFLESLHL